MHSETRHRQAQRGAEAPQQGLESRLSIAPDCIVWVLPLHVCSKHHHVIAGGEAHMGMSK